MRNNKSYLLSNHSSWVGMRSTNVIALCLRVIPSLLSYCVDLPELVSLSMGWGALKFRGDSEGEPVLRSNEALVT